MHSYYYNRLTVEQANEVDKIISNSRLMSSTDLRMREQIARLLLIGEGRGQLAD